MGLKDWVDKISNIPKDIEEYYLSGEDASFLEMEKAVQLDGYSCGVQSAFMILRYYGKARSIDRVDDQLNAYNRGYASETAIYSLFREKKLKVSKRNPASIKTIKEAIDDYEAPMLTTIDDGEHWVVVYGYSKKHIYVLDPAPLVWGDVKLSVKWNKDKFKDRWDRWGAIIYK